MHEDFNLQFIFEEGKRGNKKSHQTLANSNNKVNPKYEPDLALM